MVIVKLFVWMDKLAVQVETTRPSSQPTRHGADPTLLHTAYYPYDDVDETESLYRCVTAALRYADGYAGDLRDHIED